MVVYFNYYLRYDIIICMRSLLILTILTVLLFSKTPGSKIDFSGTILQVGAFSSKRVLNSLKSKLSSYNTLTKQVGNYSKLFVLNPTKKDIRRIKKLVPKAFLLSPIAKKRLFGKEISSPDEIPVIKLNLQTQNSGLNTKTIVQTRKKFFK